MISSAALADTIALAIAGAMLMAGAVTAWRATSVARRIGGVLVAHVAAIVALGILGAPAEALVAGVAVAFGYCALGVAVLVRLQEAYAGAEAADIDKADEQDEPNPEAGA